MDILRERGVEFDVIEYLKAPLSRDDLKRILDMLPDPPEELIRKDKHFKELGLDPGAYTTEDAVIDLLLEHPKLMQRPIAVRGERAVIARPSDKVEELLD
jgi:arsenate reductase